MSKFDLATQDAPRPTDLATLANEINDLHVRATEAARTAIDHARECGELLIQAKAQIGHGGFLPWLEANCRVKLRQAQKYMTLAREWPAIEAKCASNAHLTLDRVLRLLDSGEKLTQQEPAEVAGGTTRTVQRVVAERRDENATMSHSGDPFDEDADPFGNEWEGEEDGRTDSDGQDAQQELPPRPPRKGKDESGGSPERTPAEEFKIQRSKTIKTVEAAMRAFDDLNRLRKNRNHDAAISECKSLLWKAKSWN